MIFMQLRGPMWSCPVSQWLDLLTGCRWVKETTKKWNTSHVGSLVSIKVFFFVEIIISFEFWNSQYVFFIIQWPLMCQNIRDNLISQVMAPLSLLNKSQCLPMLRMVIRYLGFLQFKATRPTNFSQMCCCLINLDNCSRGGTCSWCEGCCSVALVRPPTDLWRFRWAFNCILTIWNE